VSELNFVPAYELAVSMLLTFVPPSDICFTVIPAVLSLAMKLVVLKHPNVLDPIRPRQFSKAIHFAVYPIALV